MNWMEYINAFWVGGAICAACQVFIDKTRLTPARILVSLVVIGVFLQAIGIYQPVVDYAGAGICITHALFGKMVEMGVTDANNMGAAMAPAAYNTLSTLLADLGAQPKDFDCIVTGDLGHVGADLLLTLLREDRIDLSPVYSDCGSLLFGDEQDAHAGGSGCGCSAAVLCGPLLRDMQAGKIKRLVFAGTGAMMSPTSVQQGQPIAGICHAVVIERSGA